MAKRWKLYLSCSNTAGGAQKGEKVSEERKSSILPLSCLTQISCLTRRHIPDRRSRAKLAQTHRAARARTRALMRIFWVIDVMLPQDWDHFSVSSLFSRCHFRNTPSEPWQSLILSFPSLNKSGPSLRAHHRASVRGSTILSRT